MVVLNFLQKMREEMQGIKCKHSVASGLSSAQEERRMGLDSFAPQDPSQLYVFVLLGGHIPHYHFQMAFEV